ncbi:hypothetical protein PTSG_08672 [Salpingoeca rosetta]|uniref:DIRP domain-containing protein n=1 Tax=Salpingoeca rosetta (strain ATCC 50818 / BSB-021) TaxID=946362 RepID=F2UKC6_SALR5|nr:uncharacterized protein PTSG_08672 [Salpingoeca rosetta]EGD77575.1 hypothetical protein PTSG_08672 [Salpingoeca rosetta]|eukprot:XP_004990463.1 hypothetical protein PTSG_08672 [Salpingoeca rosetta]
MPRSKRTPQRVLNTATDADDNDVGDGDVSQEYVVLPTEQQAMDTAGDYASSTALSAQPQSQQQQNVSHKEYEALTAIMNLSGDRAQASSSSAAATATGPQVAGLASPIAAAAAAAAASRPAISSPLTKGATRGTPGRRPKREQSADEGPPTKRGKVKTPRRQPRPSLRGSKTSSPARAADNDPELQPWMVDMAHRLTKGLKTRLFLCWSMYEFFYSSLDKVILKDIRPFEEFLTRTFPNVATVREFRRPEWFFIRKQFGRRPRRFSPAFVKQERQWLMTHRAVLRQLQYGEFASTKGLDLPPDVPLVLSVGDRVLAKLLPYKGLLSTGMILAVLFREDSYRIAFDRKELGIQTVPAEDVAPLEAPRMISSARLIKQTAIAHEKTQAQATPTSQTKASATAPPRPRTSVIGREFPTRRDHPNPESIEEIMELFFAEIEADLPSTSVPLLMAHLTKVVQMKNELLEAAKTLPDSLLYAESAQHMDAGHLRWILDTLQKLRTAGKALLARIHEGMDIHASGGRLQDTHVTTRHIHTQRNRPIVLPDATEASLAVDAEHVADVARRSLQGATSLVDMQANQSLAGDTTNVIANLMAVLFAIQNALRENMPADEFQALVDEMYQQLRHADIPTSLCNSIRYQLDAIRQQVFHGNDLRVT